MRDTGMKSESSFLFPSLQDIDPPFAGANTTSKWAVFPGTNRHLTFLKLDAPNEEDVKAKSPARGGTCGIESRSHTRV